MSDFDDALAVVEKLSPLEKIKLLEKLASSLEQDWPEPKKPRRSLYGIFADLGDAPSAEEIDEARREMWGNFPREDI